MADTPDIWPSRWPEPQAPAPPSGLAPVRPIGDRTPRFGVAHELDVAQRDAANGTAAWGGVWPNGPGNPVYRAPAGPTGEGTWAHVRTWWACREVHPVDLWHRMRCRSGRHRIEGGQRIQLGGRFVNIERCCVWCGSPPP